MAALQAAGSPGSKPYRAEVLRSGLFRTGVKHVNQGRCWPIGNVQYRSTSPHASPSWPAQQLPAVITDEGELRPDQDVKVSGYALAGGDEVRSSALRSLENLARQHGVALPAG